ncbi:YscW family type III secretion system pilotin [Pseudomonas plecoglossicida]|nr:YscW family type III secretion system pilotin [Pseudomonas plecoglossicida]
MLKTNILGCWVKFALYCCVFLLVGCVSVPLKPEVAGRVVLPGPLTRTAHLTLRLYEERDGGLREVARQRYCIDILPLRFSFRLGEGSPQRLTLIGSLSLRQGGPEQAVNSMVVSPDEDAVMVLRPLPCFPNCNGSGTRPL